MQPQSSIRIVQVYRAYLKPAHHPWNELVVSTQNGPWYRVSEEPDGSITLRPFSDWKNFDLEPVTEEERRAIVKKYEGQGSGQ